MLRIGQFTDTFIPVVDGVGRVALAYSNTLCAMGHQVTVVTPMYNTGYRGGYPFELVDFQGMPLPGNKQYKTGEAPWDSHYRARMRQIPLDICHAHSPFTAGSEALRLAVQRDIPLVATFHSKYYDDFYKATKSENMAKMGVKFIVNFYNRCDEVWTMGPSAAKTLHEYGYEGDIQLMPNGVSMVPPSPEKLQEVEEKFKLSPDEPLFLFVGQINWKKNILCVLDACAQLRQQGLRFRLILAGQGPDEKSITKKIKELGLDKCAFLIGHITDNALLSALYQRALLFVFPSLYDTWAMVAREAATVGTPTVAVRKSSAAEAIEDGKNGYLCDNDPTSLASVMKHVLSDEASAHTVGLCARETMPISWESVMERALERYDRLIELGKEGKLPKKNIRIV